MHIHGNISIYPLLMTQHTKCLCDLLYTLSVRKILEQKTGQKQNPQIVCQITIVPETQTIFFIFLQLNVKDDCSFVQSVRLMLKVQFLTAYVVMVCYLEMMSTMLLAMCCKWMQDLFLEYSLPHHSSITIYFCSFSCRDKIAKLVFLMFCCCLFRLYTFTKVHLTHYLCHCTEFRWKLNILPHFDSAYTAVGIYWCSIAVTQWYSSISTHVFWQIKFSVICCFCCSVASNDVFDSPYKNLIKFHVLHFKHFKLLFSLAIEIHNTQCCYVCGLSTTDIWKWFWFLRRWWRRRRVITEEREGER